MGTGTRVTVHGFLDTDSDSDAAHRPLHASPAGAAPVKRRSITRWIALLSILFSMGCVRNMGDILPKELSPADIARLEEVEQEMLQGYTFEHLVDERILQAVKQMVKTIKPEFRGRLLGKYKLGFLEISDIDRYTVTRLHNYITEKTLTFSFLQPAIAENFSIVERFLLKDVLQELDLENLRPPNRIIDQRLAKAIGKIYPIDIIETGVTTETTDFIDINLRMIETQRGRIIAVGSVKIEKTEPVRKWLNEVGRTRVGWPIPQ